MSVADVKYNELVKRIIEHGELDNDGDVRTVYADGESAYTKSLFGVQVKFNDGDVKEVPILTSKKVFHVTAKKEMMLFWVHQTVQQDDFEDWKVKVWQEWFNKQRNLGRSYAYQFESHRHHIREIIKVKPKIKDKIESSVKYFVTDNSILEPDDSHKMCGDILNSDKYGEYKIISYSEEDDRFLIQFLNTRFAYHVKRAEALKLNVKDPYVKVGHYGHGALGVPKNVKNIKEDHYKKLLVLWQNMIKRCYNEKSVDYEGYGGKGVFVEDRWKCFEYFLRDIRYLPQYFLAKEDDFKGWHLDKDYFGSNCYSNETCVWLSSAENSSYREDVKPIILKKDDEEFMFLTIKEASITLNIDRGDLCKLLNGKLKSKSKTVKGYSAKYLEDDEYLYRYELSRNQVVELLKNIKNNPYSRRLETNFWNFADVDKKVLQECAFSTQWNVRNGRLDMLLRQRSADIGLGVVFNQIQYFFLQCMIAHVSGLKVGSFTHQIGNLHYYDRHEEALKEQLENEQYEAPTLWINPEVKDFFDFTPDDIKLIGYQSGEYIPMEVAI